MFYINPRLGSTTGTAAHKIVTFAAVPSIYMPSRGGGSAQRQPAVVVVAVAAEPATRRRRRGRRAIMPVKSSASFRMTALPMVVAAQLLAAAVLTLSLVWVLHFRGGVSWQLASDTVYVYTVV